MKKTYILLLTLLFVGIFPGLMELISDIMANLG